MNEGAFYINPVYGFRTWKHNRHRARLEALTRKEVWPTGKPLLSSHIDVRWDSERRSTPACAPGEPCQSCGIYALEDYGQVQDHQWNGIASISFDHVRGIVAGWGRVTLCTRGWRAGKAYPLALLDWQISPELYGPEGIGWHTALHVVAQCYDIPVVPTVGDLVEVAGDAGAVSLSAWREQG